MRKILLAIALMVLTGTAMAQQPIGIHREHVSQRLEAASSFLVKASADLYVVSRDYDPDYYAHTGAVAEANFRANMLYAVEYISRSQNTIAEILSAVPYAPANTTVGEIDLIDLRRAINMPFEGALCTTEDLCQLNIPFESLAYEMSVVSRHLSKLTGAHRLNSNGTHDHGANLRAAGLNFAYAWAEVEFAIWHLNDAIYQEVHGVN